MKLENGQIVTAWDADHEPVLGRLGNVNEEEGTAMVAPIVQSPVRVNLDTVKAFDVPKHPRVIENEKQVKTVLKSDAAAHKQLAKDEAKATKRKHKQ